MKKLKNVTLSILLGVTVFTNVNAFAGDLFMEDKFINSEDIKTLENKLHELKRRDVNKYSESLCVFDDNILVKEEFKKYCKEILKESLDVLQFKIDLQKQLDVIVVPEVRTLKSLSIMYGTFLINIQNNPRFIKYLDEKSLEVESKKITEEKAHEDIEKFMDSKAMYATDKEYEKFIGIKKELDKLVVKVLEAEAIREQVIKNIYWEQQIKIMNNERYEKLFMKNFYSNKLNIFMKEVEKLLNNKKTLDMYYLVIQSGKIQFIVDKLKKSEMVTLPMEQCEFLKDFEVFSKEGLKALTCIRR